MSLLIINYEYPPVGAGAANAAFFLAKTLAGMGTEVVVMTSGYRAYRGYAWENGVHVYRLRTRRRRPDRSNPLEMGSFLLSGLLWGERIARKHRVDKVLVFFSVPCGPIGYWLNFRLRVPYIISLRGGDVPGFEPQMAAVHRLITVCRRAVLRQALAVVANSRGLADLSRRADPAPVRVIPNGIDVDFFRPQDVPPNSPERPFAFIFAGRFQAQKNLFFLMDRLKELQEVASRPFIVHMVGDGPLKADLKQYAVQLGLQGRLTWHGWVGKVPLRALYQSAGCCINPALTEGMPNAVLEAMASGLPVVASQVPGNLDLVQPRETGFLVNLNNPPEFTLALKTILEHPELGQHLGKAGRELVVRDFSWKQVAKAYLNLFRDKGR